MKSRLAIVAPIFAVLLAACSISAASPSASARSLDGPGSTAASSAPSAAAGGELTIYGAASLKGALDKAKAAYETANPGTTLTISTDSSSALETQIEQGAPADVFLSADATNPQKLVDKGLADGAAVPFAANKLTIVVPTDNPAGITSPIDLAKPGVKVIAAGDTVPITRYTTQLVGNLAKQAGYPADFVARYAANIASKEDNVKALIAKIELGEGDAGIVYVTDAKASDKVTAIDVPDSANVPAAYDGVVVKASKNAGGSQGLPRLVRRTRRPDDPRGSRVPAAGIVIDSISGAPAGGTGDVAGRARPATLRPGRWGERSVTALAALFALFLGLPVLALVVRAILDGSLRVALASPVVLGALWLSLVTTSISLTVTVVMGLPLALVLARRTFRGKGWIEAVVDLPIVLPPSVAGLALLLVFGRRGLLAAPFEILGISVPFTTVAVILAQIFVSAPFFIRSARTGIAGVDRDLEDAARVDGASERQLFRSITVPLASAALAAGLVMSWARALGEFGATIMFAGNVEGRTQTLPLVVYGEFQGGDLDQSIAAAAILVIAAFGVLVAVRFFHWGRVLDVRGIS